MTFEINRAIHLILFIFLLLSYLCCFLFVAIVRIQQPQQHQPARPRSQTLSINTLVYDRFLNCDSPHARRQLQRRRYIISCFLKKKKNYTTGSANKFTAHLVNNYRSLKTSAAPEASQVPYLLELVSPSGRRSTIIHLNY